MKSFGFPVLFFTFSCFRNYGGKLTCDPRDVRRISPAEPVGADAVVQPQSVQSELEGAHVKRTVRTVVVLAGGWLGEQ